MTFGFELVDLLNSDDSNRCLAWQKFVDPALCNMQVPCTEACVRQESKFCFGNLGNGSISETKWKWQKTISWFLFFHVFSCVLSVHCCCISISCFLGNRTVSAVLMEMKGNFVLGMSSHRLDAFPWGISLEPWFVWCIKTLFLLDSILWKWLSFALFVLHFFVQILVKAIPIKQGHELRVVWPVTPDIQHYKEGASCYLSHLIGHEGNGSLFCSLKKMGGFLA